MDSRINKLVVSGFTLVEVLVTVAILAIVSVVVIPFLSSNDPQKLSVAAEETANLLRFALSEAKRTGGYVLVDGSSTAGQLKLYNSDANANVPPFLGTSTINDPLTKHAATLDVTSNVFSQGVILTPKFMVKGVEYHQLLINPTVIQVTEGSGKIYGIADAGSGVLLTLGSQSVTVLINENTGLVTLP